MTDDRIAMKSGPEKNPYYVLLGTTDNAGAYGQERDVARTWNPLPYRIVLGGRS